jgi:tRNA pseudouridine38-40 synthase
LYKALHESELISLTNFEDLKKSGWSRGARTDKGVHALLNGVSAKLSISTKYLIKDDLN